MQYQIDFGRRVKELRMKRGMNQEELALKVGFQNRASISRIEKGERMASQVTVERIAKALNVSPLMLLEDNKGLDLMAKEAGIIIEHEPLPKYSIEEELLIELYRTLSSNNKRKILEIIKNCKSDDSVKSELA